MEAPETLPLNLPTLPPVANDLLRRLRWRSHPRGPVRVESSGVKPDPLLQAGRTLREAREACGLGLRQLAQETRISTAVIEALERGWRDRLPEAAYLRTMLRLLEEHLDLPAGSLRGALPEPTGRPGRNGRDPLVLRFTPGSIDVFTSWQGTLLYGVLTLALVYGLNLQQRRLAERGLHTIAPLPASATDPQRQATASAEERMLRLHPGLRPLDQAAEGVALARLRRESRSRDADLSLGQLELRLERPTRIGLRSERGGESRFEVEAGTLRLPVLPPFRLRLDPAPAASGAVLWRNEPLQPLPRHEGAGATAATEYLYPPDAAAGPRR
jgi:transcriptional regulator with XRE-family HTH domain